MKGVLVSINVSLGGMPKASVPEVRVTKDGVCGDAHNDKKNHGGPDQAVCLYSIELYHDLIGERILVKAGDFGENFTTTGIDYAQLEAGARLHVGDECALEITKVRTPCYKLTKYDDRLPKAILGRSGWLARVIAEGTVRTGDAIEVIPAAAAPDG